MADAISIQELIDARTDAKTLEEAVNGDAVTTVLSRLGESYPTLANALSQIDGKLDSADTQIKQAITDLFQNGGLPATPFTTKALMTASALVDGKYAMVTNDTTNNGLYVKTAGVWVKSNYDPTALANTYTDNKVKGVTNNFKTKALVVASALPDGSYAMVTEDTEANNGLYVKTSGSWVKSTYDPLAQAKTYTDTNKSDTLLRVQNVFATKALMTASALVDGSNAQVNNDTIVGNNGFYTKTAGAWVKSGYDPLKQANTYSQQLNTATNANLDEKTKPILTTTGKALHQWVDADFNIVGEIDANAGLRLAGIEGTVQEAIKAGSGAGGRLVSNTLDLTHAFVDEKDDVVGGFDTDGGLRVADLTVSLQEYINARKEPTPLRNHTIKDSFTTASNDYIINMYASNVKNAPVPFGMLPQRYTMPDAVVNELSLPNATEYIPLNTPYDTDDKVVHPMVIEFKSLFRGYRYLMCITPYSKEYHENPSILGSNDLLDWQLLTGFAQPIATPLPGRFLSDNGFCYDPINGMLVCYWREGQSNTGFGTSIRYRATRDGIDWTDETLLLRTFADSQNTSPCIIFNPNDNLWHMWIGEDVGILRHYTATNLNDDWTLKSRASDFLYWWHGEVKWVGNKFVMLVNKRDPDSNFYFATSSDGDNWTKGEYLWKTKQDAIYKGSFLPKINLLGQISFDVFYTTNHATNPAWYRKFFHITTNYSTSTITAI